MSGRTCTPLISRSCILAYERQERLTLHHNSPLPRPREALHPSHPGSASARDEGALQPTNNMDQRHLDHLLGHEPDATVRHCVIWYADPKERDDGVHRR
jgi:hypothetical protein